MLKEHARNAHRPRDQRQDAEKIVISTSDFQAALGRDKEKVFRPLYNLQVVHDIESPLVLGYEVLGQATDAGTLMPLRQRAHDLTGIWLKEILADAGYASGLGSVRLHKRMCNCMPPIRRTTDGAAACPAKAGSRPSQERIRLARSGAGLCVPARTSADADQPGKHARASRRAHGGGEDLSLSQGALSAVPAGTAVHGSRGKGRTIKRNEHEDLIVANQAKMQTPEAKAIYRKRGQTVELRFADAKAHQGIRRWSGRGLERVRIEVGLCVLAHNLLVVRATSQRKAADGQNGTSCQDAA